MSLKETRRLGLDLESRYGLGPELNHEISLSNTRDGSDTIVVPGSNRAIFHFMENIGLLAAPELASRTNRRRIIEAYLSELERSTWKWALSAFVLGLHAKKAFSDGGGLSLRPPTDDEIRRLRRWGRAAEDTICYKAMTVLSESASSEPFPSRVVRNKIGQDFERRADHIIKFLRLQGDLRLAVPLMVLYTDSLFSPPEVTALRNENPFPYPGWLDDLGQGDPDDPSWIEDKMWEATRSLAKSCTLNPRIAGRLFRHVRACDAFRDRYIAMSTEEDNDRMSVALRRYHDACESLGVQTWEEEPASSAASTRELPHKESSLESSLLNLLIALESLVGASGEGVQNRILQRVTHLVAPVLKGTARPPEISERLKECYGLRSKIVHGTPLKENDWKQIGSQIRWLRSATACAILRVHEIVAVAETLDSQGKQTSTLKKLMKRLDDANVDDRERRVLVKLRGEGVLRSGALRTDFEHREYTRV